MLKHTRKQFPRLEHTSSYAYLDSAATTLSPKSVLLAVNEFETKYRANVHRGLYHDAAQSTEAYEQARATVAALISAKKDEIIFTSGATHGLNMLASLLSKELQKGDSVVLTRAEHHANLVPWLELQKIYHFDIRFLELTPNFLLDESSLRVIDKTTKVVSVMHVSNTLGTIFPMNTIIAKAKDVGATTIIDAAQSIAHLPIHVKKLGCDFLVASGHKMYGPTGIGFLYGKKERLDALQPFVFGGDMIREVTYTSATWNDTPWKFEAGTPNIAGAIGMGEAASFLMYAGFKNIVAHEKELTAYTLRSLRSIPEVRIIGPTKRPNRLGVVSFVIDGIHPHDIAEVCNTENVAIRAGSHCTMPLMNVLHLSGTARISIGIYTTKKDIDRAIKAIKKAIALFKQ